MLTQHGAVHEAVERSQEMIRRDMILLVQSRNIQT
jgi:hypothetical protein